MSDECELIDDGIHPPYSVSPNLGDLDTWVEPSRTLPYLDENLLSRLRKDVQDPQVRVIVADWYEERGYAGYAFMLRKSIENRPGMEMRPAIPDSRTWERVWTEMAHAYQPSVHPQGSSVLFAMYIEKIRPGRQSTLGIIGRQLQTGIRGVEFHSCYGMIIGMSLDYSTFMDHSSTLMRRHPIRHIALTGIGRIPSPRLLWYGTPNMIVRTLAFGDIRIPITSHSSFHRGTVIEAIRDLISKRYPGAAVQVTGNFVNEVDWSLNTTQSTQIEPIMGGIYAE